MKVGGAVDHCWRCPGMELSHGDRIRVSSRARLSRGCNAQWNNFAPPTIALGASWGRNGQTTENKRRITTLLQGEEGVKAGGKRGSSLSTDNTTTKFFTESCFVEEAAALVGKARCCLRSQKACRRDHRLRWNYCGCLHAACSALLHPAARAGGGAYSATGAITPSVSPML